MLRIARVTLRPGEDGNSAALVRIALFTALLMLAAGCGSSRPPGVPDKAELLVDYVSPPRERSTTGEMIELEPQFAIYVYDVTASALVVSANLKPGQVLGLYQGAITISDRSSTMGGALMERNLTRLTGGHRYQVYLKEGADPAAADAPDMMSPTSQPFRKVQRSGGAVVPGR